MPYVFFRNSSLRVSCWAISPLVSVVSRDATRCGCRVGSARNRPAAEATQVVGPRVVDAVDEEGQPDAGVLGELGVGAHDFAVDAVVDGQREQVTVAGKLHQRSAAGQRMRALGGGGGNRPAGAVGPAGGTASRPRGVCANVRGWGSTISGPDPRRQRWPRQGPQGNGVGSALTFDGRNHERTGFGAPRTRTARIRTAT